MGVGAGGGLDPVDKKADRGGSRGTRICFIAVSPFSYVVPFLDRWLCVRTTRQVIGG